MKASDKKTGEKAVKAMKTEKSVKVTSNVVPHENYVMSGTHFNCAGCGHWLMSEFKFCPECGNKIVWKDAEGSGIDIDNY